jgi:hypothetical protein
VKRQGTPAGGPANGSGSAAGSSEGQAYVSDARVAPQPPGETFGLPLGEGPAYMSAEGWRDRVNAPQIRRLGARLWPRVTRGDGCWEWTGTRGEKGYGRLTADGRTVQAHRLAWELTNGPIPAGLHVLHRCDNPPCVRPEHLFLGSNLDNIADRHAKGRNARNRGPACGHAKLTAADVVAIRAAAAQGASNRWLAGRYGVAHQTIWCAIHARGAWSYVPGGVPRRGQAVPR